MEFHAQGMHLQLHSFLSFQLFADAVHGVTVCVASFSIADKGCTFFFIGKGWQLGALESQVFTRYKHVSHHELSNCVVIL